MTERNMVLDEYVAAITDAKDSGLPMQLVSKWTSSSSRSKGREHNVIDRAESYSANPTRDGPIYCGQPDHDF